MSDEFSTDPEIEERLQQVSRFSDATGVYEQGFISLEDRPLTPELQAFVDKYLATSDPVKAETELLNKSAAAHR